MWRPWLGAVQGVPPAQRQSPAVHCQVISGEEKTPCLQEMQHKGLRRGGKGVCINKDTDCL